MWGPRWGRRGALDGVLGSDDGAEVENVDTVHLTEQLESSQTGLLLEVSGHGAGAAEVPIRDSGPVTSESFSAGLTALCCRRAEAEENRATCWGRAIRPAESRDLLRANIWVSTEAQET